MTTRSNSPGADDVSVGTTSTIRTVRSMTGPERSVTAPEQVAPPSPGTARPRLVAPRPGSAAGTTRRTERAPLRRRAPSGPRRRRGGTRGTDRRRRGPRRRRCTVWPRRPTSSASARVPAAPAGGATGAKRCAEAGSNPRRPTRPPPPAPPAARPRPRSCRRCRSLRRRARRPRSPCAARPAPAVAPARRRRGGTSWMPPATRIASPHTSAVRISRRVLTGRQGRGPSSNHPALPSLHSARWLRILLERYGDRSPCSPPWSWPEVSRRAARAEVWTTPAAGPLTPTTTKADAPGAPGPLDFTDAAVGGGTIDFGALRRSARWPSGSGRRIEARATTKPPRSRRSPPDLPTRSPSSGSPGAVTECRDAGLRRPPRAHVPERQRRRRAICSPGSRFPASRPGSSSTQPVR